MRAPAKVNLALHVLSRRPDGYHELDGLMFPVSIYDVVELSVAPSASAGVSCRVTGPEAVADGPGNIAAQAAELVLAQLRAKARVNLRLWKRVPHGAGLGGGSSDAAAVLRLLPRMLGRRLAPDTVRRLALRLGADVPFFLGCRPARARGVGENLTPLAGHLPGALVIVVGPDRINTGWAFREALPDLTCRQPTPNFSRFGVNPGDSGGWFSNDFQERIEEEFPAVARARKGLLRCGAESAVLSGSGCAVAGYFADRAGARIAAHALAGSGKVFLARILRGAPRASGEADFDVLAHRPGKDGAFG